MHGHMNVKCVCVCVCVYIMTELQALAICIKNKIFQRYVYLSLQSFLIPFLIK
jgi:hypothetical protein